MLHFTELWIITSQRQRKKPRRRLTIGQACLGNKIAAKAEAYSRYLTPFTNTIIEYYNNVAYIISEK